MKPFWQSKRWAGLMICLLALTVLTAMEAPPETLNYLAGGLGVALPVMIGGESMVDKARVERPTPFSELFSTRHYLPATSRPPPNQALIETDQGVIMCQNVEALNRLVEQNRELLGVVPKISSANNFNEDPTLKTSPTWVGDLSRPT